MTATGGEWLFSEMRSAADDYRQTPEWLRPVVTVPNEESVRARGTASSLDHKVGFAMQPPSPEPA